MLKTNNPHQQIYYIIIFLLLFLPFDVGPTKLFYYSVLVIGSFSALFIWLKAILNKNIIIINYHHLLLPVLGLVAIALLSNIWTVDAFATQVKSFTLLTIVILFWLVFQIKDFSHRIEQIVDILTIFLGILSLIGLYQFLFTVPHKFAISGTSFMRAHSVFVWPNTFAGYIILLWPVVFMRFITVKGRPSYKKYGTGLVLILSFAALMATYSRGGWLSFLVMIAILFLLLGIRFIAGNFKSVATVFVICGIIVLLFISLPGSGIADRLADIGEIQQSDSFGRLDIWRNSIKLIGENPILGTGYRTFHVVNTAWLPYNIRYDFAHNDYLQITIELGLVGLVLLLWFILSYGISIWHFYRHTIPAKTANTYLLTGMIAGTIGTLTHSLVDFDLYIPGIGIVFWVFIALIISSSRAKVLKIRTGNKYVSRVSKKYFMTTLVIIITLLALIPTGSKYFQDLGDKQMRRANPNRALQYYRTASFLAPHYGNPHKDVATAINEIARHETEIVKKLQLLSLARTELEKAILYNPRSWQLWKSIALFYEMNLDHFVFDLGNSVAAFNPTDSINSENKDLWLTVPQAHNYYRETIKLYPNNRDLWKELAQSYLKYNYLDSAIVWHEKLLAIETHNNSVRTSFSESLLKNGDFQNSITNLEKVLAQDSSYSYAWFLLGENYLNISKFEESTLCFENAVNYGSDSVMIKNKIESLRAQFNLSKSTGE